MAKQYIECPKCGNNKKSRRIGGRKSSIWRCRHCGRMFVPPFEKDEYANLQSWAEYPDTEEGEMMKRRRDQMLKEDCKSKISTIMYKLKRMESSVSSYSRMNPMKEANFEALKEHKDIVAREKIYTNGYYVGQLRFGKEHGYGTFYLNDDNGSNKLYEGEWQKGKRHGHGTYYYSGGDRYEGDFENGKKHGHGTYYYSDGDRYEGDFENGERNGRGRYYYKNKDFYVGQWIDGRKNGVGRQQFYDSCDIYLGEWKDDKKNGTGMYYWYDKCETYEGEWNEDKRHGYGKHYYANGDRFEGEFAEDMIGGYGILYKKSGESYSGIWSDRYNATDVTKTEVYGEVAYGKYVDAEFIPE